MCEPSGVLAHLTAAIDLDHTLITSLPWDTETGYPIGQTTKPGISPDWLINYDTHTEAIYKRPGATEFLEFCGREFGSIGIWTASIKSRAQAILRVLLPRGIKLAFVLTRDSCVNRAPGVFQKPLRNLWSNATLKRAGFAPSNTLLIDDNPATGSTENLILVSPYIIPSKTDSVLQDLIRQFSIFRTCRDVRPVLQSKVWRRSTVSMSN